jgi:hypothetical protein
MTKEKFRLFNVRILSLFFALPFPIVALMVRYGPLSALTGVPGWFKIWFWPILITDLALGYGLFRLALGRKKFAPFSALLTIALVINTVISILAALTVHRDFFTATFQHLLCTPAALLLFLPLGNSHHFGKAALRTIGRIGYALSVFYAEWIILMGYAIATRAEPRPVESIVYNIYNLALVFVLFAVSRQVNIKSHRIVISGPDSLSLNGRDISTMTGQKKTLLLNAFATAQNRTLRCPEIQQLMAEAADGSTDGCAQCLSQPAKAAQCGRYRTTYNAILDLKKLLELLEIGSISASENRRNILAEGWKLVLFENVRLTAKK